MRLTQGAHAGTGEQHEAFNELPEYDFSKRMLCYVFRDIQEDFTTVFFIHEFLAGR